MQIQYVKKLYNIKDSMVFTFKQLHFEAAYETVSHTEADTIEF